MSRTSLHDHPAATAVQWIADPGAVMLTGGDGAAVEAIRRLRTLLVGDAPPTPQVIVVTSPVPADGTSFVALNLALAMAEASDEPTLLIDAELRRGSGGYPLKPAPNRGLRHALADGTPLEHVVLTPNGSTLSVLPAGGAATDAGKLLASAALGDLVAALRRSYRRIVIDSPPVLLFADADLLGRVADGFLVVVRAGRTPAALYRSALTTLHSAPVLGTVLNRAQKNLADGDTYDSVAHCKRYAPRM